MKQIVQQNNLTFLQAQKEDTVHLIYIDPPFNTGKTQKRTRKHLSDHAQYTDRFKDYSEFITPRLQQAHRILKSNGSIFVHLDYREVHNARFILDSIFSPECFMNEIIWAYDYGGRSKTKWPAKHDNILWYVKDPSNYTFNYNAIDRIPYLAPGLVGPVKAARGKTPTDVWWQTIVTGKEKTGYPTQKPIKLLERILKVHSNKNDLVLDFFAGSGTTGAAAEKLNRKYIMVDDNPDAIETMKQRLPNARVTQRTE